MNLFDGANGGSNAATGRLHQKTGQQFVDINADAEGVAELLIRVSHDV